MRAERRPLLALACAALGGCGLAAGLTRPEGDGGWSGQRRAQELSTRAEAAGVAYLETTPIEPAAPLTLPAALALAAHGNRRIAVAGKDVEIARQRVFEARGRLLASAAGTGRYTWYSDPLTNLVTLPPGFTTGSTQPGIEIREAQVGTLNGTVTVPLDVSGELWSVLAGAQAGYRGERARLWATTLAAQVEVQRSYFALLEAERLHQVTRQRIASQRRQLESAESRFRSGRLTKNELLVVRVALLDAEQELVQRELATARARWALNQAVGLPVDAPTAVVDVSARPQVPTADEALREAWAHNPVLIALLEEQQRLEASARALARSRLPRVSGGGAIDYSSSDVIQPQDIGSGFLGFTWDLGIDGRREADIAAARIATERNRVELERQMRELEAAVRLTLRGVEERLAALAAAEAAVTQAEENLRIREQQFDVGRATSDDVLEAEAILAAQRATLASALYQGHALRAELQQLIGLPLDEGAVATR